MQFGNHDYGGGASAVYDEVGGQWIYRYENQGETVTLADGRRLFWWFR